MPITLIVETGSKPAGANSYLSVAEADQYHSRMANADWAGLDEETKKQALVVATHRCDDLYGSRYLSSINSASNQSLLFPRLFFYDHNHRAIQDNQIPDSLKRAVAELALLHTQGVDLAPIEAQAEASAAESISVGPISISTSGRSRTGETYTGFRRVDLAIRPIVRELGGSWRLAA